MIFNNILLYHYKLKPTERPIETTISHVHCLRSIFSPKKKKKVFCGKCSSGYGRISLSGVNGVRTTHTVPAEILRSLLATAALIIVSGN